MFIRAEKPAKAFALFAGSVLLTTVALLSACGPKETVKAVYDQGDRVTVGSLTYNVIETDWKNQLGQFPSARIPDRNFFLVRVTVTNGSGGEISLPFFTLENEAGDKFTELSDGTGVDHWFGLLRKVQPAQTEEGWILFDVPTNSYKLHVTDAAEAGKERTVLIQLPLKITSETTP